MYHHQYACLLPAIFTFLCHVLALVVFSKSPVILNDKQANQSAICSSINMYIFCQLYVMLLPVILIKNSNSTIFVFWGLPEVSAISSRFFCHHNTLCAFSSLMLCIFVVSNSWISLKLKSKLTYLPEREKIEQWQYNKKA